MSSAKSSGPAAAGAPQASHSSFDPKLCSFPPYDRSDRKGDTRGIKVGERVCVKSGFGKDTKIDRGEITKVYTSYEGTIEQYKVKYAGKELPVNWRTIGRYPVGISQTAARVVGEDKGLPPDVIRKIQGYGRKKTRRGKKVRRTTRKR